MTYSIVYSNPLGNTKMLADSIYETLGKGRCKYFGKTSEEALGADIIFVGFWTIRGCCDDITKDFLTKVKNEGIFLFGSAGFGLSMDYFNEIVNATKEYLPLEAKVLDSFMCQGKMKMAVREKYMSQKEKDPENPKIDMMIKNFDMALSHPDQWDLSNLKAKAIKVVNAYEASL